MKAILWFRRNLRLGENPAIVAAARSGAELLPIYILDEAEEGAWPLGSASKWWLHHSLLALDHDLKQLGSGLTVFSGEAKEILADLCRSTGAVEIFTQKRWEPEVIHWQTNLQSQLKAQNYSLYFSQGYLLADPEKFQNKQGRPFQVFTPFFNSLEMSLMQSISGVGNSPKVKFSPPIALKNSLQINQLTLLPTLNWADGFNDYHQPGESGALARIEEFCDDSIGQYSQNRDIPSLDGTSRLSAHLTFGEISPTMIWRHLTQLGENSLARPWLRQLAWREFAWHLLFHFPHTSTKALRPEFNRFPWKTNAKLLRAWQKGQTGYPLVDSGMRELWKTGLMHNRVRMVCASFLVKHLLIPWQEGAKWFWDTLVDADLANNSMGWQWVAGSGADAAPYFRIFNPTTQAEKFDPDKIYQHRWIPELKDGKKPYPSPIVDHSIARTRALEALATIKNNPHS